MKSAIAWPTVIQCLLGCGRNLRHIRELLVSFVKIHVMHKLFFLLWFLLPVVLFGQTKPKKALRFETVEIIRKDIPYDSKDLFLFTFKNKSKKPVSILSVQTSCGCTTAQKPEEPIAKNKKGQISVSYDTKRVGEFVKSITVTSNVGDPVVLTIRGNVLPEKQ